MNKIQIPTKPELRKKYDNLNCFEAFLLYCVISIDSNLFIFIGGVLVTIPVTLLLNLVSYKMQFTIVDNTYIISYFVSFVSSIFLGIDYIALTIRHIEIRNSVEQEKNIEIYINKLFDIGYSNLKYLKKKTISALIFFIFMLVSLVLCFICKNYGAFVEQCIVELLNNIICIKEFTFST